MPIVVGKTQKQRVLQAIDEGANNRELVMENARVCSATLQRLCREDKQVLEAMQSLNNPWTKKSQEQYEVKVDKVTELRKTMPMKEALKQVGISRELYYRKLRKRKEK